MMMRVNTNEIEAQPMVYHIAYFITDHGLGHAARSCELITRLVKHHPVRVTVVTSVPQWFLKERLSLTNSTTTTTTTDNIDFITVQVDVGVKQELTEKELVVNVKDTLVHLTDFWLCEESSRRHAESIASQLTNVHCIVYDITPLAPMISKLINVPCIAVTNFAWNWLYADWLNQTQFDYGLSEHEHQLLNRVIQLHTEAYSHTDLFIKLPYCAPDMAGLSLAPIQKDLGAWLSGVEITNHSQSENRNRVMRTLFPNENLDNTKLMLYSFGGGQELQQSLSKDGSLKKWKIPEDWTILINMSGGDTEVNPSLKHRVLFFSHDQLTGLDLTMIDILTSVDVLCCKTGYGVVSEALTANVPGVLYCDRPGFCEHYLLVQALEESLQERCQYVRMWEDVLHASSDLFESANKVLEASHLSNRKQKSYPMDGGIRAARFIWEFLTETIHQQHQQQ